MLLISSHIAGTILSICERTVIEMFSLFICAIYGKRQHQHCVGNPTPKKFTIKINL